MYLTPITYITSVKGSLLKGSALEALCIVLFCKVARSPVLLVPRIANVRPGRDGIMS